MPDIKKFNDEEFDEKAYNTTAPLFEQSFISLVQAFNEVYTSAPLGHVLRELNSIPFTNAINESVFVRIFYEIILSFNRMGTFEQYIFLLKTIFGEDVTIEFIKTTPGEIIINVGGVDNLARFGLITHKAEGVTSFENGVDYGVEIVEKILNINPYDIEKLVRDITPAGAVCTMTIL